MNIPERVEAYLASQPEPTQTDLRELYGYTAGAHRADLDRAESGSAL